MRRSLWWVLALALLAPSLAAAEQRRAGTRELIHALELIRDDRCDAAVPFLRSAYEIGQFKNALWNLAECYVVLNRPELAVDVYREYVAHPRTGPDEEAEALEAAAGLERQLAIVQVRCNVAGAAVQVDGRDAGHTPAELRVGPGEHRVSVTSPGYSTWAQTLTTGSGERRELLAEVRPLPGSVSATATPAGAAIWVDGQRSGPTPWEGSLEGGTHVVEARLEGHRTERRRVDVVPGQRSTVAIALGPEAGTLAVGVDAEGATLRVDGEARASSPFGPLDLAPGRYALSVTAPGHAGWEGAVDVLDRRTTRVDLDLASTRGLHQGWFWSVMALTLSSLAAGTALVLVGRDEARAFEEARQFIVQADSDPLQVANRRELGAEALDRATTYDWAGWSLVATGGAGVVATLVLGLLTRFRAAISAADVAIEDDARGEAALDEPTGGRP